MRKSCFKHPRTNLLASIKLESIRLWAVNVDDLTGKKTKKKKKLGYCC